MAKHTSPLKSTRLIRRRRRRVAIRIFLFFFFLVVLIGGLSYFSYLSRYAIQSVTVSGASLVNQSDVQNIVSADISGSYWGLFSKSNTWLYPKHKIESDILATYSAISSVKISPKGRSLVITVVERTPTYLWCTGTGPDLSNSCYFADSTGFVFASAPAFSGNSFFTLYGALDASSSSPIGSSFVSPDFFKVLIGFMNDLTAMGIKTNSLVAEGDGVYHLNLDNGGILMFTSAQDPIDLEKNVQALLTQTKVFSYGSKLLYVDLRFGDKVYYRLADNPMLTTVSGATSTATSSQNSQ